MLFTNTYRNAIENFESKAIIGAVPTYLYSHSFINIAKLT